MASFLPTTKKNTKSPAFPPIQNSTLNYSTFSLNDDEENSDSDDDDVNSDENDISDDESEDESEDDSMEDSDDEDNYYANKRARKKIDMIEMDSAAKLLLSVSPRIMPSRPRSLSHLEPLESLAGLAMLGEPKKKEVEKLRSCLAGISSASPMGSLSLFNDKNINYNNNNPMMKKKKKSLKIRFRFRKKKKASDDNIDKNDNTNKKDKNNTLKKKGKKRKRRKKPSGHTEHWTLRDDDNNNIYEEEEDDIDDKTHAKDVPEILHNSRFEKDYNKKGKIGIYTPAQRRALLQKFREKRRRRVWYKKVRYGCRKNLADRRLRIKGRFVRADSQEYKDYFANLAKKAAEEKAKSTLSTVVEEGQQAMANSNSKASNNFSATTRSVSSESSENGSSSTETVKMDALSSNDKKSMKKLDPSLKVDMPPDVTMSKTMRDIMKNNQTTTATLALNLSGDNNNSMFMKSKNPKITPTAFSMMANKNGRARAHSSLL